jgi:hypothetical protein
MFPILNEKTIDERKAITTKLIAKYKNNCPLYFAPMDSLLKPLAKPTILANGSSYMGSLLLRLKKQLEVDPNEAIFLNIHCEDGRIVMPLMTATVSETYHRHKQSDGLMYISYCKETTFGNQ